MNHMMEAYRPVVAAASQPMKLQIGVVRIAWAGIVMESFGIVLGSVGYLRP